MASGTFLRRRQYEVSELLVHLNATLEFCEHLGINIKGRLKVYRRALEDIISAESSTQARTYHLNMACLETMQLADMLEFFRSHPPEALRSKLDTALQGPTLTIDERTSSNRARNVFAELWLASKLWRAGIDTKLGEPDISCTMEGKRLLFECKRPFRPAGVKAAIHDARTQIKRHLEQSPPGTRGIIFVSLSKILYRWNFAGTFKQMEELGTYLKEDLRAAERKSEGVWHKHEKAIIGIAFHAAVPSIDVSTKTFALGECIDWISLAPELSLDDRQMHLLAQAVGEST